MKTFWNWNATRAVGRDAADVAMTTLNGPSRLLDQSVEVSQIPG